MDHIALDGAGSDDGDFDHEIVEAVGFHAGEGCHLCAAFDLEDADGVGFLHEFEGGGIVFGECGEIDGTVPIGAEFDAVLHGGHHAESEQVDLDDAEFFAVVFIPLGDNASWHGSVLEGDDLGEATAAEDHAAGVLSEMAWEIADGLVEAGCGRGAGVRGGDSGFFELFLECEGVGEISAGEEGGEAAEDGLWEVEGFTDFAHGATSAEGDDIGGHGCAFWGVASVEFLDDGFAACAAGEIEVDIWPAGATFGEESFEEEFTGDGVAGGDTEGVTDGGVRGGAASLDEDIIGGAEVDDVPDDEEVAGEAEATDEFEFVVELGADFSAEVGVSGASAGEGDGAEEGFHGFAGGHGVFGEGVAEVREGEGEGVGEVYGVGDGFGAVGEEALHLGWWAEVAFGVWGEGASGVIEVGMEADAGEEIEDFAMVACGAGDAAGGEEGEFLGVGEVDAEGVEVVFSALEVALDLDEDAVFPEGFGETVQGFEGV